MAVTHGNWNRALGVPCEFVLLNSPSPADPVEGRDIFTVNAELGDTAAQVEAMRARLSRMSPEGRTPLGARIEDICRRLAGSSQELRQSGRRIMLTIATDGVPDSRPELVRALQQLPSRLPVRVVIRLCTDDDQVVDFYNDLDKDVEMPLDIIDDFCGEATEIRKFNPWLVYTPMLQTIREAGTSIRILDFLDERALTPMEVALLSQLLMQHDGQPAYSRESHEFLRAIEKDLARAPAVFDVGYKKMVPPLHLQLLRAAVCPKHYAGPAGIMRTVGLGSLVDWYFELPSESETEESSDEGDSEEVGMPQTVRWPCSQQRPTAPEILVG
jgi:hypothetical protein